jgi:hypothetical protein
MNNKLFITIYMETPFLAPLGIFFLLKIWLNNEIYDFKFKTRKLNALISTLSTSTLPPSQFTTLTFGLVLRNV